MTLSRKWILGGIAAALLTLALGFVLLINPALNNLSTIQSQTQTQIQNNTMLATRIETLKQQATEVPAKLEEIAKIQAQMPKEMEQPHLVRLIESAALQSSVDLTGITPTVPVKIEGTAPELNLAALPFDISARGNYTAIKTFVSELEGLPRVFLIRTLDVSRPDLESADLELALSGSFYTLEGFEDIEAVSLPGAEAPAPGSEATAPAPSESPTQAAAAIRKPAAGDRRATARENRSSARGERHSARSDRQKGP